MGAARLHRRERSGRGARVEGVQDRDVKLENVLLTDDGAKIKLADFGFALDFNKYKPVMRLGTLEYMAPEVMRCTPELRRRLEREGKGGYGPEVDCWAVGILAYECLVGQTPYEAETMDEALELIEARALFLDRRPDDNHAARHGLSQDARDFILGCLNVDPALRLTAAGMLSHPWIVKNHPHLTPPAATTTAAPLTAPPTTTPLNASHDSLDNAIVIAEPGEHRGSFTAITTHLGEVRSVAAPTAAPSVALAAPSPRAASGTAIGLLSREFGGGSSSAAPFVPTSPPAPPPSPAPPWASAHLGAGSSTPRQIPTADPNSLLRAATFNSEYDLPGPDTSTRGPPGSRHLHLQPRRKGGGDEKKQLLLPRILASILRAQKDVDGSGKAPKEMMTARAAPAM